MRVVRAFDDPSPWPGVVSTVPDPRVGTSTAVLSANLAVASRVVIPKSGTLYDVSIFVATASGSVDVGVYSITSSDTRTRLWSSGAVGAVGTNAWQNIGDPNLSVFRGQILDFALAVDNGTVSTGRAVLTNAALGSWPASVDVTAETHTYAKATSFPLPATFTSVVAAAGTTHCPLIVARIG